MKYSSVGQKDTDTLANEREWLIWFENLWMWVFDSQSLCFPRFRNCFYESLCSLGKIKVAVKGDYRENCLSPSLDFQQSQHIDSIEIIPPDHLKPLLGMENKWHKKVSLNSATYILI